MVSADFMLRTATTMLETASAFFGGNRILVHIHIQKLFVARFGCSLEVSAKVHDKVQMGAYHVHGSCPQHCLWALFFMTTNKTEKMLAMAFESTEKAIREWVWSWINAIASIELVRDDMHDCCVPCNAIPYSDFLSQISWDNRFVNDNGSVCLVTVDSFECPVKNQEQRPTQAAKRARSMV